ncbi:MATE family efflux transporter [Paenibacillus caseinilyticus]|uniref:MATE family efflux transporter n=1 Tax=Paenibacillus caseinilyticus TaxID=3098138 RepID=UPI0022B8F70C|nr:MATE family efflux transporter [Paenibacillus caseinilyticus]
MNLIKRIPTYAVVAGSAWISRIISAALQILIIRLLTDVLSASEYAYFVLLTSLTGWYNLSSFGVGYSLQNYISELRAKGEDYRAYISTACLIVTAWLIILVFLLYTASTQFAPTYLKQFDFLTNELKINNFFIVGIFGIVAGITGIIYNIWYSVDKGYLSSIIPAISAMISFGSVYFLSNFSSLNDKLTLFLIVYVAPAAILPGIFFIRTAIRSWGKGHTFQTIAFKLIIKRALQFGVFGIMAAAVVQIDYIIMSQNISSEQIVIYNITTKIYSIIAFVYSSVLTALWPEFTKMISNNEWIKVRHSVVKYITFGIIFFAISSVVLIFLMPFIVGIISPKLDIVVPVSLLVILALYHIVRIWTDTYSMVLQSMSDLKMMWLWTPAQIVLNGALQFLLSKQFGIYGIVLGLILSYLLTLGWALPKRFLYHAKQDKAKEAN